ncbi:MAG: LytTR family DNA-binding domain-containing protein [Lachnospiraceae bacterium]|nr:LytTR family DNA-binding domain-containing protein [Lachnospiraceae bacterium]
MVKIAVCDNGLNPKDEIRNLITAYAKQCGLICQMELFDTGEDFVKLNGRILSYKVVFLIIQDFVGIAIAQKIREFNRDIILVFVADNDTFVQEGYKVDAIRYLIRGQEDFEKELRECMHAIFDRLHYALEKKVFSFREGERELSIDRILYVESSLHRLIFHVVEEEAHSYTLYGTLNQMEEELSGHDFVRVHQSFLVNMKHIRSMNGRMLVLSNNEELRIVKARLKGVRESYDRYREIH